MVVISQHALQHSQHSPRYTAHVDAKSENILVHIFLENLPLSLLPCHLKNPTQVYSKGFTPRMVLLGLPCKDGKLSFALK